MDKRKHQKKNPAGLHDLRSVSNTMKDKMFKETQLGF